MLNLNNLFVSETCSKSCAIDSRTSFLALAITVKNQKIVSETCTKWLQIGAISQSRGFTFQFMLEI